MDNYRRVFIYRNEAAATGSLLIYDPKISLETLKAMAGQRLGLTARRLFLVSGAEVQSEIELQNGDNLYFSSGEAFYRSSASSNEKIDIAVLGAGGVGKSALVLRYLHNTFVNEYDPTIQDVYQKTVRVDDEISVLEVLDTAGQEDFVSMRSQWMMDKDGYIFVYSLLDKSSVRQLFAFVDLLSQVCDGFDQAPPVVFVGTKQDVVDRDGSKRVTTLEEVRYLIEAYEEASRALDRRSTAHHRASQHSGASNSGLDTSQPSISVGNVHDSFQSSGLLYEHSGLSTESMSPMGLPGKTIGLSPWMEKIHMETSALSGANIDHAFVTLTREVRKRRKESEQCAAKPQDKPKSWWSSSWCSIL